MSAQPDERTPLIGQTSASEEAGGVDGDPQAPGSPQLVTSVQHPPASPPPRRTNAEPYGLVALLIFIVVIVVLITFLPRGNPRGATDHIISARALTHNIFEHLKELMDRAKAATQECGMHTADCAFEASGGRVSRSVLTGYNSSATYVYEKLKNETHCDVHRQDFLVPVWEQVFEPELSVTFFTRLGCDKEEPGKGDPGKGDPGKGDPGKGKEDKGKGDPGKGKEDKGKGEPDKGKEDKGKGEHGKGKRGHDEPDKGNPPNDTDTFVAAMLEHDLDARCNGTYYINNTIVFKPGFDFWQMRNGGQMHELTGQQVYNMGDGGCQIDAQSLPLIENRVVLVKATENCTYWDVAYNAQKAGASAVIFYNPNSSSFVRDRVRIIPWKDGDPVMEIPVLLVTSPVAQLLATARDISHTDEPRPSLEVSLRTNATLQIASTHNLICDWAHDSKMNKSDTVVFGAHLDSVPEGPGMVDNGSGAMTLLEIVLALDRAQYASRNPFKFIWWGAEEIGSLGARYYVRNLTQTGGLDDIAAYLNFDMLGSSNWIPMVLNGADAPRDSRNASEKVTQLLADFFTDNMHKFEFTGMVSGSDFVPFLDNGIPCGGLYTGSSEIKNVSQVPVYGGMADVPLDTCYHKECDQVENVNYDAIELMSQATLHAVTTLAQKRDLRRWLNTLPEKSEPEH